MDRASLKAAVDEWLANEPLARAKHGDIAGWDVTNVTDMSTMFSRAPDFNGDLSQWNVANVTDMTRMFSGASAFNGDLSQWNVGNVSDMFCMFAEATAFHGDLTRWDLGRVRWGKAPIEQRIRVTTNVQRFALHAYETAVALRVQRVYRTRAIRGLGKTTHTPASLSALGGAELKAMLDWHPSRPAFGELLAANA